MKLSSRANSNSRPSSRGSPPPGYRLLRGLVVVPLGQHRHLRVQAAQVLVEQVVAVVAAELVERLGDLGQASVVRFRRWCRRAAGRWPPREQRERQATVREGPVA
jgi:hypothetical protein